MTQYFIIRYFLILFAGKDKNWTVMKTKRISCNAMLLKMYNLNKINFLHNNFVYMKRLANALLPKSFYAEKQRF